MFRLRIKRDGQTAITTKFFNTLQEVAEEIKTICQADTIQEILKAQKEFNYRFYVKEIKK